MCKDNDNARGWSTFHYGKVFGLRGGKHRGLVVNNFKIGANLEIAISKL